MTAVVLRWHRHVIVPYGDLGGCDVCGAFEGEIPTDCPGVRMTEGQRQSVMWGNLDYIWREGWTTCTRLKRLQIKSMLEP